MSARSYLTSIRILGHVRSSMGGLWVLVTTGIPAARAINAALTSTCGLLALFEFRVFRGAHFKITLRYFSYQTTTLTEAGEVLNLIFGKRLIVTHFCVSHGNDFSVGFLVVDINAPLGITTSTKLDFNFTFRCAAVAH